MEKIIDRFFKSFFNHIDFSAGYFDKTPKNMMDSDIDNEGYYKWKPIDGTLTYAD